MLKDIEKHVSIFTEVFVSKLNRQRARATKINRYSLQELAR
jgi:hypothetical protein